MSRVLVAAAVLALAPVAAARGEPISVTLNSATSGFSSSGPITAVGTIDRSGHAVAERRRRGYVLLQRRQRVPELRAVVRSRSDRGAGGAVRAARSAGGRRRPDRSGDQPWLRAGRLLDVRQPRRAQLRAGLGPGAKCDVRRGIRHGDGRRGLAPRRHPGLRRAWKASRTPGCCSACATTSAAADSCCGFRRLPRIPRRCRNRRRCC